MGVEFGEPSQDALRRELREELGAEIESPRLLGVLENIFTFDGSPGHEIGFAYNARFADQSLYQVDASRCKKPPVRPSMPSGWS